jgi:hypothetical protein
VSEREGVHMREEKELERERQTGRQTDVQKNTERKIICIPIIN